MRLLRLFALYAAAAACGLCAPQLAPLFRDHAVLQCDKPVPVWGTAAPGEHLSVAFSGQTVGATAGADGRWIVVLAPRAANPSGSEMSVTGQGRVLVRDVVVGEVWLCAGQSTMDFCVDGGPGRRVENAAAEVAAARYPLIRQFKVDRQAASVPLQTVGGDWTICTPDSAGRFTAVGYFFARDLFVRLGVPVGIITCTCPGAPIEAWMSPAALASAAAGAPPAAPAGTVETRAPAALFCGMIHPLLPYALRGALWAHGEEDAGPPAAYGLRFAAMITAWRSHFGEGDFPFLWVQLAGFRPSGDASGLRWAALREAQASALRLPATGQAVAIDLGGPSTPLPVNKQEVGRRLALIAKATVYSIPEDYSGPVYSGMEPAGSSLRVHFTAAGDGLTASGRPLQSFEVAGADRLFHPAAAVVEGDSVVVRSPAVRQPVAVRYAWSDAPDANLYNGAGLPAAPFRSDEW